MTRIRWSRAGALATVVAVLVVNVAVADAAPIRFRADLGPEVVGATGTGVVTVLYDEIAKTLAIATTFSGLSGLTTVAHIHCCTAVAGTGTVGVAVTPGTLPGFPTNVSGGSYATVLDLSQTSTYTGGFLTGAGGGTAMGAEAALIAGIYAGKAYFNVHSTAFPPGEIRGFLAVPEPASLLLLGAGLAGMLARRRRR